MAKIKNQNRKLVARGIVVVAVFGLSFFVLRKNVTQATDCSQLTGDNKDKCEVLEKKAQAYQDLIDIKNKQQNTLQNQMALIDAEQERNKAQLQLTQGQAEELTDQISGLEHDIAYKEELMKYQQAILRGLLQSYYEDYQSGVLGIVLINKDFSDILNKADYVQQSSNRVSETLGSIHQAKNELQKEYEDIQQKKQESEKLKQDLQSKNYELQSNEIQKQTLLAQTQGEEQKYQELLTKVREQQEQIAAEINNIEAGKAGGDLGPLPPKRPGLLADPVNPVVITQNYGKTNFSYNYASGRHNGIDFGVSYRNVYAAGEGKILATGNNDRYNNRYAYGRWVAIDHGNGLVTLYGHFSKILVSKGEKVKGGEVIGISGNTGFSTGPHLHFTVFARKTFEIVESTKVSGLLLPTGATLNPRDYL